MRKQWLYTLIGYYGVLPGFAIGGCLFFSIQSGFYNWVFYLILGAMSLTFLLGYALYRCSYVKNGTKLLTTMTVIYLVQSALMLVSKIDRYWFLRFGMGLVLTGWWTFVSYRLIKANKLAQKATEA